MMKCSIIGCGKIAGGYDRPSDNLVRTHAKAFSTNANCKLQAVCDVDLPVAKKFAETWAVADCYSNAEDLISKTHPDLLSICTPTATHETLFDLACEYKIPLVWLEKPAASSSVAVKKMIDRAQIDKVKVWVNYFRRYDQGFIDVQEQLKSLGPIQHVRAIYTKGLRHNASHMIDLILWYFGNITEIKIKKKIQDKDYPSVSLQFFTAVTEIELVALDYHQFEMFELDIIGSLGRIRILDGGQQIHFEGVTTSKYYPGYKNLNLIRTHHETYGQVMKSGLERGLNGLSMPGLPEELAIQQVIERCEALLGCTL